MYENIRFPGWEVVRKIGEGSFGGVYEIHRTLPDGRVEKAALKKLTVPKDSGEIEELLSRSFSTESITAHYKNQMSDLVREYSLTQELSSCGNVVTCHDIQYIQQPDGIGWDVYIRMELLQPLKKALDREYREDAVIRLGLDLCNALSACQKKNIIHRDIKPENILVSPEGAYKLTDFGIAKVSEKTGSGTLAGTNGYMAPEVANRQHYGPQADIYSLGMVLYWMMNDRTLPFLPLPPAIPSALQRQEAANRRFAGERLPEPVNGSQELKTIVMKACAFSTKKRYQTVQELSNDLRVCQQPHRTRKKIVTPPPVSADKPDCANEPTLDDTYVEDKSVHSDSQNKPVDASRTASTVIPPKEKKSFKWVVWILLICCGMLGIVPTVNAARTLKYQAAQKSQQLQMEQDYQAARQLMADGEYLAAEEAFEALDNFEDSADKAQEARHLQEKAQKYQAAQQLLDDGEYLAAAEVFDALGGFENSFTKAREARHLQEVTQNYQAAQQLMDDEEYLAAAEIFSALDGYEDSAEKAQEAKNDYFLHNRQMLAAGWYHTVGLCNDGGAVSAGYNHFGERNVNSWKDIVAVAASGWHTVGLHSDGTVVSAGRNDYGQCDVGSWKDNIVAVAAGWEHTVGLYSDGTVIATGSNDNGQCDVSAWRDIVAVAAGGRRTAGLRSNGTVVTTGENWHYGTPINVENWKNIVAVAVGYDHIVGLHNDGTVVATGQNDYGQCDVGDWRDIVAVAAGESFTVGLRNDGTVVATGRRDYGQCKVDNWKDIVSVTAGEFHTVGLRSDGTVVAAGWNCACQCNVGDWKNIRLPQ